MGGGGRGVCKGKYAFEVERGGAVADSKRL